MTTTPHPNSRLPFWLLAVWLFAIIGVFHPSAEIAWAPRLAVLCAGIAAAHRTYQSTDPAAPISPLLILGMISVVFFSILPALYFEFVLPSAEKLQAARSLSATPATLEEFHHSRFYQFLGSPAEQLILQFSASCFLAMALIASRIARRSEAIPTGAKISDGFLLGVAGVAAILVIVRHTSATAEDVGWVVRSMADGAPPMLCLLSALAALRAFQAIAKCRKASGTVRKTSKGTELKRWQAEKRQDTKSGKPCGAGGKNEYCRPTKKVSSKTPTTKYELSPSKLAAKKAEKSRVGMGRRVSKA